MEQMWQRLKAWREHKARTGLVIAVATSLSLLLLDILKERVVTTALGWFWSGFRELIAMPIGVAGLAVAVIIVVLVIAGFIETSPFVTWLTERRRSTTAEATSSAEEVAGLRAQVTELQARNEVLERDLWRASYHANYGSALRDFNSLQPVAHEDMISKVAELWLIATPMIQAMSAVWEKLPSVDALRLLAAEKKNPERAQEQIAEFVRAECYYPVLRLAQAVREVTQAKRDPRPHLLSFYVRYRELRERIQHLASHGERHVITLEGYKDWFQLDREWCAEWSRKLAGPNFSELREQVWICDEKQGTLPPLPKPTEQ